MIAILLIIATTISLAAWVVTVVWMYMIHEHIHGLARELESVKSFLINRALTDAVLKDMGTLESPYTMDPSLIPIFEPFETELIAFYNELVSRYARYNKVMTDRELYWEISRRFSTRFVESICVPNKLESGETILNACYIAKGRQSVDMLTGMPESELDTSAT